ncbi:MAG: IPT/TIG domain-containing protein [Planctomycetes bacterium]|nr:IPT/TIG domain-containing protein [Planctomycetota bacterium]
MLAAIDAVAAPVLFSTETFALVQVPAITMALQKKLTTLVITVDGAASNAYPVTIRKTGTPAITAIEPAQGTVGAEVLIKGENLGGLSGLPPKVTFGAVEAARAFSTGTTIVTWIPAGLAAGSVSVTVSVEDSAGVTLTSAPSTFQVTATPQPTVLFYAPKEAHPGDLVFLNGADLGAEGQTTTVTINGAAADLFFAGQSLAVVAVPAAATVGTGSLTVAVGGATSAPVAFTVTPASPPVITSFEPANGIIGSPILVKGENLGNLATPPTLKVGASDAWPALPIGQKVLVGLVPKNATTGVVSVTVGSFAPAQSGSAYTVDPTPVPTPVVSALVPSSGPPGSVVRILGYGFGPVATDVTVTFGGVATTVVSGHRIDLTVIVPSGAASGNVVLTRAGGSPSAGTAFTVTAAQDPVITAFSKTTAAAGKPLVITGTNFFVTGQPPSVTFAGAAAPVVATWRSNTSIFLTVPSTAVTGAVTVTVNGRVSAPKTLTVQ